MIKNLKEVSVKTMKNSFGKDKLFLYDLSDFENKNPKLRLHSQAVLKAGEEVSYHLHIGKAETYYILSGIAM